MDSMRNFGSGFVDNEGHEHEDEGVEAPPQIGTDERRMHVRAYNFWAQMLGERSFPAVEDLDVGNLSDFGPHAVLLDFTGGIENPAIAFVGEALREECQLPEDLGHISEVPGRSLLSRLTDHYLQIIANQAPIGFEAEFVNDRGINIMYRGILLPFSSDDDSIDFILGVMNWKEVADKALSDSLRDEVAASVRHAPPANAVLPGWADGPDSEHIDDAPTKLSSGFASLVGRAGSDAPAKTMIDLSATEQAAGTAEPDADAGLADWLSLARDTADAAKQARVRSRSALYGAISRAYDFSLVAEEHGADYRELLDDAGIAAQDRAPMTPVVKLVFGTDYDKTRLTEYATALTYAHENSVARGDLATVLERYDGGLKALVRHVRAARRTDAPSSEDRLLRAKDALRDAPGFGIANYDAGDDEFILFVGRKHESGQVAIVGVVDGDKALTDKAILKCFVAPDEPQERR